MSARTAAAAAAIAALLALTGCPGEPGQDFNCADFATRTDAQRVLDADPDDPYGLDRDGDGTACESLPTTEETR